MGLRLDSQQLVNFPDDANFLAPTRLRGEASMSSKMLLVAAA